MAFSVGSAHKQLARAAYRLGRGALDLLYPPQCLSCEARVPAGQPLCPACLARLERPRPAAVRHRLQRLPVASGAFETVFALWHFAPGGALQALQHALKYRNRPRYGVAAGQLLGAGYRTAFPSAQPEVVVPVPLHRARRLERGYNQSAMLARGAAGRLGLPCLPDGLVRVRPTRPQTSLSRQARWANVARVFEAAGPLEGRATLLVDDVLTTGATATAAGQTLRQAGATPVHLATLGLAE